MLRNHNHRRSAFTIFVILILTLILGCQNRTPEAMTLRVHIIDGLSESKTVMPDGFRGVDRYELTVVDNGGTEVAKAMANNSVDAVVDGIAPGSYTFAVKGYTTISGVEHLIVDDNESVTVKDGMSEVSVAVSDVAAGTGAVDVTITAGIPDGYTFADDVVTVRLYEGVNDGETAYETTVGYSVNGDTMTAEWVSDSVETGIYTMEVQADGLFGKTVMYVLPGMTANGSVEVNPMVADKVATPVISEVVGKVPELDGTIVVPPSVGDTVTLDGIECLIVYDAGSKQEWGQYLCVDKNHDISFYLEGSDFANANIPSNVNYGYEWGGYGIELGLPQSEIGTGLSLTNILIQKKLQPSTKNWPILWDKVVDFRKMYSDEWFVPSSSELNQVYKYRTELKNITTKYYSDNTYMSCNEGSLGYESIEVYAQDFTIYTGFPEPFIGAFKDDHNARVRLCRYAVLEDFQTIDIEITTSTDGAEIYYTITGLNPDAFSNIYSTPLEVGLGTVIKARAYKDGMIPSDIAEYVVE